LGRNPRGPRPQRLQDGVLLGLTGQRHDPHRRVRPADRRDRAGTARRRHVQVHDGDVGVVPADHRGGRRRVVGRRHDADPPLAHPRQQQGQAPAEQRVVVDEHDVDLGTALNPGVGLLHLSPADRLRRRC
jgi:hypothetical protein